MKGSGFQMAWSIQRIMYKPRSCKRLGLLHYIFWAGITENLLSIVQGHLMTIFGVNDRVKKRRWAETRAETQRCYQGVAASEAKTIFSLW